MKKVTLDPITKRFSETDIKEVKQLYVDQSLSIRDVGLTLHRSAKSVKDTLKKYGIPINPHTGGMGRRLEFNDVEMDKLYIQ